MSWGVGHRPGSDLVLLWLCLWCRPTAPAPIRSVAWEPPYAASAALKRQHTHTHTHTKLTPCLYLSDTNCEIKRCRCAALPKTGLPACVAAVRSLHHPSSRSTRTESIPSLPCSADRGPGAYLKGTAAASELSLLSQEAAPRARGRVFYLERLEEFPGALAVKRVWRCSCCGSGCCSGVGQTHRPRGRMHK